MNYLTHYLNLCNTRKLLDRKKTIETYFESHHIVPKSLGGIDDPSNLVLLTPKEHFIAHLLLFKHYKSVGGEGLRKMAFAFVSMSATNNPNFKRSIISSARTYSTIREAAHLSSLGRKVKDTSNYKGTKSDAHKESIRQARLNSPPRSSETRLKMKKSALKRGNNFTGVDKKVECPHCKKSGQKFAMLRWHFDNCKIRKEVKNAELA